MVNYTSLKRLAMHGTAKKKKGLNSTNNLHLNKFHILLLLSPAPIQLKFFCSALPKIIFSFRHHSLQIFLINRLASTSFWRLEICFCEIYRQYIGTGYIYIFVKYIGNISRLAALARQMNFQRCPALEESLYSCLRSLSPCQSRGPWQPQPQ